MLNRKFYTLTPVLIKRTMISTTFFWYVVTAAYYVTIKEDKIINKKGHPLRNALLRLLAAN